MFFLSLKAFIQNDLNSYYRSIGSLNIWYVYVMEQPGSGYKSVRLTAT
jgi:hypothetical protein